MDRLERKRGFSQVSQASRNAQSIRHTQVPKTASSTNMPSPGFCSPPWAEGPDKENCSPIGQVNEDLITCTNTLQPNFHYPLGLTPFPPDRLQRIATRSNPLQALTEMPSNVTPAANNTPLPVGQDPFVPSLSLDYSSRVDHNVLAYISTESSFTIHEDQLMMEDIMATPGPPTPSELNIQNLSLLDLPKRPLPEVSLRPVVKQNRTSVHETPTSDWEGALPNISPNDIIIVFAKGKQALKVDKYPLCTASRYFSSIINGPFPPNQTLVLRLRNDFPHAITTMLEFVATGTYTFSLTMKAEHPHITLLDLHAHMYIIGTKYDIPDLVSYAMTQYLMVAQMCLSMPTEHKPSQTSAATIEAAHIVVGQFVDSLALVWRGTCGSSDELRMGVLELIKGDVNRLSRFPGFVSLMRGFDELRDDVLESLREDGFEVWSRGAWRGGVKFA
ncbi:hypothetical protein FB567DRAFT_577350 [Paraphoma chrysanthemicola]|uniref:BTB domain-containing protein n=1 Tax=Paraphoma chrysanthemicola TaxID=798071 RepID=A0A8K0RED6_9PLEO|nr:hypothetical protein FB567DRAFT_577350 [Paraphoma chrysanthemicola]